jgi:hypothetical protein
MGKAPSPKPVQGFSANGPMIQRLGHARQRNAASISNAAVAGGCFNIAVS